MSNNKYILLQYIFQIHGMSLNKTKCLNELQQA